MLRIETLYGVTEVLNISDLEPTLQVRYEHLIKLLPEPLLTIARRTLWGNNDINDKDVSNEDVINTQPTSETLIALQDDITRKVETRMIRLRSGEKETETERDTFVTDVLRIIVRASPVFRIYRVPEDYYSRTLTERVELVCAPSVWSLCKTLVFHNTKDATDDHYYAVVVPYARRLQTALLEAEFRKMHERLYGAPQPARKRFHLRLVDDIQLQTGYPPGGVVPFGLASNSNERPSPRSADSTSPRTHCMGIICSSVLDNARGRVFIGGGRPELKLEVPLTQELITHWLPQFTIASVTIPRDDAFDTERGD